MTARKAAAVAEACRAYLAAHERRSPSYDFGTLRESQACRDLLLVIAGDDSEAVAPNIGTAA